MANLPVLDFAPLYSVILILVDGKPVACASYGDYNKQDVLESIGANIGLHKLEILNRLPAIWSRT